MLFGSGIGFAAGKAIFGAVALSAILLIAHGAYNRWESDVRESERKSVAIDGYRELLKVKDEKFEALKEFHRKAKEEVDWARDYREKQDARIAELQAQASPEIQECLDMQIDPQLLGW